MKLIKKISAISLALLGVTLASCSSSSSSSFSIPNETYKDGTYEGQSEKHDADSDGVASGYAVVVLTIESSKLTSCKFTMYELDGTVKDEHYGENYSKENYVKAQKAIQAGKVYAQYLVEKNSVDVISGATITYSEFKEAVNDALAKAKA